jgi:hypothetical protein
MDNCSLCREQAKKSPGRKPHEYLQKIEEERVFSGSKPGGFTEQDYQCRQCAAKFTHSNDKNNFGWTLWQG